MNNVATALCQQIGHRDYAMIGAKNIVAIENGIQFRVGSNPLKVTNLRITLQTDDTYKVESFENRGATVTLAAVRNAVWANELHECITAMTGMYGAHHR